MTAGADWRFCLSVSFEGGRFGRLVAAGGGGAFGGRATVGGGALCCRAGVLGNGATGWATTGADDRTFGLPAAFAGGSDGRLTAVGVGVGLIRCTALAGWAVGTPGLPAT